MDQIVQPARHETKKTVEMVVHISEELNEDQRNNLTSGLETTNGITGAEFSPLRYHLMLVKYDTDVFSSRGVLRGVESHNVHARLIGPV